MYNQDGNYVLRENYYIRSKLQPKIDFTVIVCGTEEELLWGLQEETQKTRLVNIISKDVYMCVLVALSLFPSYRSMQVHTTYIKVDSQVDWLVGVSVCLCVGCSGP